MTHQDALANLSSNASDDRLRAARYLTRHAGANDSEFISNALREETNRWVKSALRKALAAIHPTDTVGAIFVGAEGEEDRVMEQIHAEAVEETTKSLLHEIRPILGRLTVHARGEISTYDQSKTKIECQRLQDLLMAIDKLSQAAAAPIYEQFDLAELVDTIVASEQHGHDLRIDIAGPKPFVLTSSSNLVHLVFANAVRNAIESTKEVESTDPIVVSFGSSERDFWIAVLDRGRGLPSGSNKVFDFGATNKKGHLGVGLTLARQAALTINGAISLSPREGGGACFEFRWPYTSV